MSRARPGDYQRYWASNINRVIRLIKQAYERGNSGSVSFYDLSSVGQRLSPNWRGSVTLSSKGIVDFTRYYVLYLGEALFASGALTAYGDTVFRIMVTADLMLQVDKLAV